MELPGITWHCTIANKSGSTVWRARENHIEEIAGLSAGWKGEAPADVLQSAELAAKVRGVLTELPIDYETVLTAKDLDGPAWSKSPGSSNARLRRCGRGWLVPGRLSGKSF